MSDLASCAGDDDCCAGSCLSGYCCPSTAICPDADGNPACCGGLSVCDTATAICIAIESRPARPVRAYA